MKNLAEIVAKMPDKEVWPALYKIADALDFKKQEKASYLRLGFLLELLKTRVLRRQITVKDDFDSPALLLCNHLLVVGPEKRRLKMDFLKNLETLEIRNAELIELDLSGMPKLRMLALDDFHIYNYDLGNRLDLSSYLNVKQLFLEKMSTEIVFPRGLECLSMSNVRMSMVDLINCTSLHTLVVQGFPYGGLDLSYSPLVNVSLRDCPTLSFIGVPFGSIPFLEIEKCPHLKSK